MINSNSVLAGLFFIAVYGAFCVPTSADDPRVLSMAITLPETNNMGQAYDHTFRLAQATGMKTPGEITFYWDEVEKRSDNGKISYSLPFLDVTKGYIQGFKMRPVITICPFETAETRVPKDLRRLPLDHPKVQKRFADLICWVHSQTKDMKPYAIVIGNEFDVHFAHDEKKWAQFKNLYVASIRIIRSQRG